MSTEEDAGRQQRRYDPDRRARIIDACLDVIAEVGVVGTTHRRVAARAGVPLGSMTYHFAGMDDLLHTAFQQFGGTASDAFEQGMAACGTPEQAAEALVEHIVLDAFTSRKDLILTGELYTLAARDERCRQITHEWMRRSRAALERHFPPTTARILDALIEGMTLHRALDTEPYDRQAVTIAMSRIIGGTEPTDRRIDLA